MLHFAAEFSHEVLQKEPNDLHRHGFKKGGCSKFHGFKLHGVKIFGPTASSPFLPKMWCPLSGGFGKYSTHWRT